MIRVQPPRLRRQGKTSAPLVLCDEPGNVLCGLFLGFLGEHRRNSTSGDSIVGKGEMHHS